MNLKPMALVAGISLAALLGTGAARGDDVQYGFKAGESATYEITVKTEFPKATQTQQSYVVLRADSVNENGQITLRYGWGILATIVQANGEGTNTSPGGSLAWMFSDPPAKGTQVVIDPLGAIVEDDGARDDAQLDASQGPAWRLVLPPLPPAGQNSWTTHRKITLFSNGGSGPGGFGGPFVGPFVGPFGRPFGGGLGGPFGGPMGGMMFGRPANTPADETTTYNADAPQGNRMTVHRNYDLLTETKPGDSETEHLHGDGQYAFDTTSGRVTTLEWKLTGDAQINGASATFPITVDAHLLTPDELATLKKDVDVQIAQAKDERAKAEAKNKAQGLLRSDELIENIDELPDSMGATEMLGITQGGGPFAIASRDRKPVIGFEIKVGDWFGHRAFSILAPLYERPTGAPDKGATYIFAREGYAVGSITVNGAEFLNALCVTFMKVTDTGLDPTTAYTSQWYGRRTIPSNQKLGGDGRFIYGIYGRRGLNVDAIGLITDAGSGGDAKDDIATAQAQAKELVDHAKGSLSSDELIQNINDIPGDMQETEIMGSTQSGGPFAIASKDHKPVIGFRIKLGNWSNRVCFSILAPVYEKPTLPPDDGAVVLMARDGYAVGSITVNAGEFLNAMCVRFVKKTDTGLDPQTFYVSPWYGRKVGTSQKKLDGKGGFVYGICGRKGLNVDAIGLVIDAASAPADDSDKP